MPLPKLSDLIVPEGGHDVRAPAPHPRVCKQGARVYVGRCDLNDQKCVAEGDKGKDGHLPRVATLIERRPDAQLAKDIPPPASDPPAKQGARVQITTRNDCGRCRVRKGDRQRARHRPCRGADV